mgnify:CR=1 FL=1
MRPLPRIDSCSKAGRALDRHGLLTPQHRSARTPTAGRRRVESHDIAARPALCRSGAASSMSESARRERSACRSWSGVLSKVDSRHAATRRPWPAARPPPHQQHRLPAPRGRPPTGRSTFAEGEAGARDHADRGDHKNQHAPRAETNLPDERMFLNMRIPSDRRAHFTCTTHSTNARRGPRCERS